MSYVLIFLLLTQVILNNDSNKLIAFFLALFLVSLSMFQNTMYSQFQPTRDISSAMSRINFGNMSGVVFTNSEMVSDVLVTESVVQVDRHTFSKFYRGQDLSFREGFHARQIFDNLGLNTSAPQVEYCAKLNQRETSTCTGNFLKAYFESRNIGWVILSGKVSLGQRNFLSENFELVSQPQPISVFKSKVNH